LFTSKYGVVWNKNTLAHKKKEQLQLLWFAVQKNLLMPVGGFFSNGAQRAPHAFWADPKCCCTHFGYLYYLLNKKHKLVSTNSKYPLFVDFGDTIALICV
jgi:hypothetical protein